VVRFIHSTSVLITWQGSNCLKLILWWGCIDKLLEQNRVGFENRSTDCRLEDILYSSNNLDMKSTPAFSSVARVPSTRRQKVLLLCPHQQNAMILTLKKVCTHFHTCFWSRKVRSPKKCTYFFVFISSRLSPRPLSLSPGAHSSTYLPLSAIPTTCISFPVKLHFCKGQSLTSPILYIQKLHTIIAHLKTRYYFIQLLSAFQRSYAWRVKLLLTYCNIKNSKNVVCWDAFDKHINYSYWCYVCILLPSW